VKQKKSNSETDNNTINDTNSDSYDIESMTNEEAMADTIDAAASTQDNEKGNGAGEETVDISEKYAQYEVDGVMVINDDIFADWYCDVYDNLDDFKGKKCKYLAQVYSMEDFKENQFLAGRYFMVCCAADLVGYGITCESDIRSELKDEEWITVEGTIDEYEYNGYMVPLLTDVTITKAEAPDVTYIYYNNY
jgi:putative membrane protein